MKLAKCACGLWLGLRYRQRPNTNKQLADVTSSKKISLFIFSDRTRRDVSLNGFVCVAHTHTHTRCVTQLLFFFFFEAPRDPFLLAAFVNGLLRKQRSTHFSVGNFSVFEMAGMLQRNE